MAKDLRKVKGSEFLLRALGHPRIPVEVITMDTGMCEYKPTGGDTLQIDAVTLVRLVDGSERIWIYVKAEKQD